MNGLRLRKTAGTFTLERMYSPQTEPVRTLTLAEPKTSRLVVRFFRAIMHPFARLLKFARPLILFPERMVEPWNDFINGKIRLLVGFRHAYGDDPQMMVYTIHKALPAHARKIGKPIRALTHVHFVYGAEVPLWSGSFVRWVLPRAGALPVNHVHMDSVGMGRIRRVLADGDFPLALAPEGHVTHTSETVPELETGTARFCFWCQDDLEKQNRSEEMVFLPVSIHYRYHPRAGKTLSRMLSRMEKETGLPPLSGTTDRDFATRLIRIGEALLEQLSSFYREEAGTCEEGQAAVLEAALASCERFFSLAHDGSNQSRIYRVRAAAWDRLFRSDMENLTPLGTALAGRESGEAWYAMRHLETASILYQVSLSAIPPEAPLEQYIEIANNLYDLLERLKGGTLRNRANLFLKHPVIVPGEPVTMSDYRELYRKDKRAALDAATEQFRESYRQCIREYREHYPL